MLSETNSWVDRVRFAGMCGVNLKLVGLRDPTLSSLPRHANEEALGAIRSKPICKLFLVSSRALPVPSVAILSSLRSTDAAGRRAGRERERMSNTPVICIERFTRRSCMAIRECKRYQPDRRRAATQAHSTGVRARLSGARRELIPACSCGGSDPPPAQSDSVDCRCTSDDGV